MMGAIMRTNEDVVDMATAVATLHIAKESEEGDNFDMLTTASAVLAAADTTMQMATLKRIQVTAERNFHMAVLGGGSDEIAAAAEIVNDATAAFFDSNLDLHLIAQDAVETSKNVAAAVSGAEQSDILDEFARQHMEAHEEWENANLLDIIAVEPLETIQHDNYGFHVVDMDGSGAVVAVAEHAPTMDDMEDDNAVFAPVEHTPTMDDGEYGAPAVVADTIEMPTMDAPTMTQEGAH